MLLDNYGFPLKIAEGGGGGESLPDLENAFNATDEHKDPVVLQYSQEPKAMQIAQRNSEGNVTTNNPVDPTEAVNLGSLDDLLRYEESRDPVVGDELSRKSAFWINTTNKRVWICTDAEPSSTTEEYPDHYTSKAWQLLGNGQSIVVDIGSAQESVNNKAFPRISVAQAEQIYALYIAGVSCTIHWTLLGSTTDLHVLSADEINGSRSIDFAIHNQYHVSYTWAKTATTGNTVIEVKATYVHCIAVDANYIEGRPYLQLQLFSSSATPFTSSDWITHLPPHNSDKKRKCYPCTGVYMDKTDTRQIIGVSKSGLEGQFYIHYYSITMFEFRDEPVDVTRTGIDDTVIEI